VNRVAAISFCHRAADRAHRSDESFAAAAHQPCIRTIHGSLAIEGNLLTESQITVILEGKRGIDPPREVQEMKNALAAYDRFGTWKPEEEKGLLETHRILMTGLIDEAGLYRHGGVGVMAGQQVIHMAPPADRMPHLMADLFDWLAATDAHPLTASSVFHYEFEFIHPFADGNGRMGRLWQSLILARWNPLFADIPVESLILEHQAEYYQAIRESTQKTDSAPFIAFMLRMILDTVTSSTPEVTQEVTPEVRLLSVLAGEMTRQQLKEALGLKDNEHFRKAYLLPAWMTDRNDHPRQAAQQQTEIPLDRQGPPGDSPARRWITRDTARDNPPMHYPGR
jgi:Fic family protein